MTGTPPAPENGLRDKVAEGARLYNGGHYWHAHEAWEDAWNALKAADAARAADLLQGLILVTAAFENRARGKEKGFKRQMANGLHKVRENGDQAPRAGLDADGVAAWADEVTHLYLEACKALDWEKWRSLDKPAPPLPV